jgi:hypothetical protein
MFTTPPLINVLSNAEPVINRIENKSYRIERDRVTQA